MGGPIDNIIVVVSFVKNSFIFFSNSIIVYCIIIRNIFPANKNSMLEKYNIYWMKSIIFYHRRIAAAGNKSMNRHNVFVIALCFRFTLRRRDARDWNVIIKKSSLLKSSELNTTMTENMFVIIYVSK